MQHVSDIRSNENDQIVYAAKKLGKSTQKHSIFRAVYFGKTAIKTVDDIAKATKLSRKRVLDIAKTLVTAKLINQTKFKGDTAYTKDEDYKGLWKKVLAAAGNKKKLDKIPTKTNPIQRGVTTVTLRIPRQQVKIKQITIDDVSSFEKIRKVKAASISLEKIPEPQFKKGVSAILQEKGKPPKDWGGEKNDLFTTRLKMDGKRYHAAFAFKGPGMKVAKLMQKHLGKNGDQVQRLYESSVQVFFVQYWKEIDQSVVKLMEQLSIAKSYTDGRTIYFGIIDGDDSARLIQAYKKQFK